jgi:cytochrome c biogenesis protein
MASPRRIIRRGWRQLTSMRTALVLLFLLALAAVPGSLLPQRPLNPPKVQSYLDSHGSWGTFLDKIGAFDVFGSIWFVAVYLLLWLSLIGCLIPRITVYAKALRSKPIAAPRHLSRLSENAAFVTRLDPERAAAAVRSTLRPRWRNTVRVEEQATGPHRLAISAEKGYSREAGNLVFHVSLLIALVLIAGGRLLSYQGSIIVQQGPGFCNTAPVYDSLHLGRAVSTEKLAKFCIDDLNSFVATYRPDGTAEQFKADVTYSRGLNGAPEHDVITVNHPLRLEGDRVYLLNHGFAPTVTVRTPDGRVTTDTETFLPQDAVYTSEGAFKFQGLGPNGTDLGIQGLFAPDPVDQGNGVIVSGSPQINNPVLAVIAFTGDTSLGDGVAQSVYSLNTSKMKQIGLQNLSLGTNGKYKNVMTLPDGTTITFDGYKQWVTLQVSHDPTQFALLIVAVLMVTGLLGSLAIRRRRLWVRLRVEDTEGSRTLVEVGGLARTDAGNFHTEFESVLAALRTALNAEPADLPVGISAGKD